MAGADQATIRAYLQTVTEIRPKKFKVTWSRDTVPVTREEALRGLQAVSPDGSEYTFAAADPMVATLQPGRILWIWGIALRRIDRVDTLEGVTIVHTRPVALTDALTEAEIEFDAPVHFADAYGTTRPQSPTEKTAAKSAQWRRRSPLRWVLAMQDDSSGPAADTPDNADAVADDQQDIVAGTGDGANGTIAGFEYSLGYRVNGEKLRLEFEARKEEEEGQGAAEGKEIAGDQRAEFYEAVKEQNEARHQAHASLHLYHLLNQVLDDAASHGYPTEAAIAKLGSRDQDAIAALRRLDHLQGDLKGELPKVLERWKEHLHEEHEAEVKAKALASAGALAKQVFFLASDNLDVRFKADLELDSAGLSSAMKIVGGKMQEAAVHFADMKGRLDLEFIGRMGQPGNGSLNVPVAHVPVMFNVPMPIYGVPFVFQMGGDFLVKLFLSGQRATQHFSGHYTFDGTAGFQSTPSKTDTESTLNESDPEVGADEAMSPGTSGSVLAVQLPRVGLGVGLFGVGTMAFLDVVNVVTFTNSAAVAVLNPQCRRVTLDMTPHIGVEVALMPIPIPLVQTVGNALLSQYKEIGHHHWERITPDIKMCHI